MKYELILEPVTDYQLVLVCGLYKTRTSLVTVLLEKQYGFYNPAQQSNPHERGYARNYSRYFTRECIVARSINRSIITSRDSLEDHLKIIKSYINSQPLPLVIKDPMFCYTLHYWIEASSESKVDGNILVIFTKRSEDELIKSWKNAPFTSYMLKTHPDVYSEFKKYLKLQVDQCIDNNINYICIDAAQIKL